MDRSLRHSRTGSHWWYWAIVPTLAILAYLPSLWVGFLSDDYGFLFRAETRDLRGYLGWNIFLPSQGAGVAFYRPFGMLTTWQLNWQMWGLNPFPYHLLGLLLHAATSLVLGLWVSDLVRKRSEGLLAGMLFAVFPIHLEAVGWLSAQWDIWAALFAITSLWLFNKWWQADSNAPTQRLSRRKAWLLYGLALLAYTLAIFSKESTLTWIGVLGLVPLFSMFQTERTALRKALGKVIVALLPFCAVLLGYLTIRFVSLGSFGGYAATSNSPEIFLRNAIGDAALLLAPINPSAFGDPAKLLVGIISGVALLLGLVFYGRRRLRAVAFCLALLVLTLVPVLNLEVFQEDLQGNRLLYLPLAGYCTLVMILVQAAINSAQPRLKTVAMGLVGIVLAMFVAVSWLQLSVWQTATTQANDIGATLARLIPHNARAITWYVQDSPDSYKGAQVMRNGLDDLYHFLSGAPPPTIVFSDGVEGISLVGKEQDAFALRFAYDEATSRFDAAFVAGLTGDTPPLNGEGGSLWNFQACSPEVVAQWEAANATVECKSDKGLVLSPQNNGTQSLLHTFAKPIQLDRGSYVRLGISVRYPLSQNSAQGAASGNQGKFFWSIEGDAPEWAEDRSRAIDVSTDGDAHVYWMVVPGLDVAQTITKLRYDTASDSAMPIEIGWIAVDEVK